MRFGYWLPVFGGWLRNVDDEGMPVQAVMVAASPANPFAASVIAVTPGAYHLGEFGWFRAPRIALSPDPIPRREPDEVVLAAMQTPDARDYLTWARFPFFEAEETADGYVVRIGDARYADSRGAGRLSGVTVRLGPDLRPLEP
jgi:hypothetical protein